MRNLEDLQVQLTHRPVWMASSIHRGEERGVQLIPVDICMFFILLRSSFLKMQMKLVVNIGLFKPGLARSSGSGFIRTELLPHASS